MQIHEADKNFIVYKAQKGIYNYHNYTEFLLEGFGWYEENKSLIRVPERLLENFNENMQEICRDCAGGSVRLRTNTKKMAVKCKFGFKRESATNTQSCDAGFDLYRICNGEYQFVGTFRPNLGENFIDMERNITDEDKVYDYILYMPIMSHVEDFSIGFEKDAVIEKATERKDKRRVVVYGSSISQGGCASRPGLSYPSILSRMLGVEFINLGFAGNCLGEEFLAKEIAKLNFDAFIMEYDENTPDATHLLKTHQSFFEIIRKEHKNIPIIIITKPDFRHNVRNDIAKRREIIYATYKNAVEKGDKNVYYIDGREMFPDDIRGDFSNDTTHPNDMGFYKMANKIYPVLKRELNIHNFI